MPEHSYTVTVHPEHWLDEPAALARQLGQVVEVPEARLVALLASGPLVLEQGLAYDEAVRLKTRLGTMGIPTEVTRATGEATSTRGADERPTAAGAASRAAAASGGWEALFPDLDEASDLDEDALDDEVPGPVATRVVPLDEPGVVPDDARFGAEPLAPPPATELVARPTPRAEPSNEARPSGGAGRTAETTETAEPSAVAAANRPRAFDAAVVTDALAARKDEELGPYAPTGFDARPDHVPLIAATLSALAPGAGQIYNGQEQRALEYGLRFMFVRPWIASVRDARARAERIRSYHAPRPPEGVFLRALRYLVAWQMSVVAIAVCLVWAARIGYESWQIRQHEAYVVQAEEVFDRALTDVQFARVQALSGVQRHLDEVANRHQAFTMSPAERAHRLYVLGHGYCASRQYDMCEATMKRVTNLQRDHRDAFRLQTWASVQARNADTRTPMPDVGPVPTLLDFELLQEGDPDVDLLQPAIDALQQAALEGEATAAPAE